MQIWVNYNNFNPKKCYLRHHLGESSYTALDVLLFFSQVYFVPNFTMSNERPVTVRKSAPKWTSDGEDEWKICIVHNVRKTQTSCTKIKPLSDITIKSIRKYVVLRQKQVTASLRMDKICSNVPEDFDKQKHGYHRWYLQTFTNNKDLKTFDENQNSTDHCELSGAGIRTSTRVSAAESSSTLFPQDEWIFLWKEQKADARRSERNINDMCDIYCEGLN